MKDKMANPMKPVDIARDFFARHSGRPIQTIRLPAGEFMLRSGESMFSSLKPTDPPFAFTIGAPGNGSHTYYDHGDYIISTVGLMPDGSLIHGPHDGSLERAFANVSGNISYGDMRGHYHNVLVAQALAAENMKYKTRQAAFAEQILKEGTVPAERADQWLATRMPPELVDELAKASGFLARDWLDNHTPEYVLNTAAKDSVMMTHTGLGMRTKDDIPALMPIGNHMTAVLNRRQVVPHPSLRVKSDVNMYTPDPFIMNYLDPGQQEYLQEAAWREGYTGMEDDPDSLGDLNDYLNSFDDPAEPFRFWNETIRVYYPEGQGKYDANGNWDSISRLRANSPRQIHPLYTNPTRPDPEAVREIVGAGPFSR